MAFPYKRDGFTVNDVDTSYGDISVCEVIHRHYKDHEFSMDAKTLRHHVGTVYSDKPDDESAPLNLLVHFLDLDYAEGDAEKGIDLNYKKIIGVSRMKEIDRQKDEVTGALTVKVEGQ